MPRLIVLLLILISLATLAVQNRATELPLVLLSSETPPIPVGLLLVSSVCIGSFVTVVLYGLVGLGRPPESKYRPMGQRVPYPNSPGSTTLPPSGPASESVRSSSSYKPGGSSSAFVSSPPSSPPAAAPQDSVPESAPQDSMPEGSTSSIQDAAVSQSTDRSVGSSLGSSTTDKKTGIASGFKRHFGGNAPTPPVPDSQSATASGGKSSGGQGGIDSLKKKFKQIGRKFEKEPSEPSESAGTNQPQRREGDDWGELRTVAHRNSWDGIEESEQSKGLFGFLQPGSSARQSAERMAGEIASGWSGSDQSREYAGDRYGDGYGNPQYDSQFTNGDYSTSAGRYSQTGYDELDQGWESFDDYDAPPPPVDYRSAESRTRQSNERRVYGESLYGSQEEHYPEARYREGPYVEDDYLDEGFAEAPANEMGPDGVYEADYRVIVPPSKSLDDDDDYIG